MVNRILSSISVLLLMVLCGRCLEPYNAPSARSDIRNLVVDGFYNASDGTATVRISRVIPVGEYHDPPPESSATVGIVDDSGVSHDLTENTPGMYVISNLMLAENEQVQLTVKTLDGRKYESEVVPVLHTPPIDSVTWDSERTGVAIKVSTHNQNNEPYYYWRFSETWYYTARYNTNVVLSENHFPVPKPPGLQMFECWSTIQSTDILVASASTLEDRLGVISEFPLTTVLWESPKLEKRYSMLIEQRSVTKETFEFLDELRKNTENLGTLFDPLPSAPAGNIHSLSNPGEEVLGYFSASTIQRKRIFFDATSLNRPAGTISVTGNEDCFLSPILMVPADWLIFVPVGPVTGPFLGTSQKCVDCRLRGGSPVQPDFWEW